MAPRRVLPILLIGLLLFAARGGARAQPLYFAPPAAPAALPGAGFTYQGQLSSGGSPVDAACDFQFSLWDALSAGAQLGSTQTIFGVLVTAGRFTVLLNSGGEFGPRAFDGSARWLAIAVKCPPDVSLTNLSPRQALTPVPLAFALPGLRTEQHALSPNVIGGHISNTVSGGVYGATIGGGGSSSTPNTVSANYAVIGGGQNNTILVPGTYAMVGGGTNNTASGIAATVGGGNSNLASGFQYATVGGGYFNTASGYASTAAGGENNTASGFEHATVGGGGFNTANGQAATVGGGGFNTASGLAATLGGGWGNVVTTTASYGTIAGGIQNTASGTNATVGGGLDNTASGGGATVPGGASNLASGDYSLAAGRNARAVHEGAFVWADSTGTPISSTATNQFLMRATGGISLSTTADGLTGCSLSAGGGTWDCTSDRNAKENFAPVDGLVILNALAGLPIETWNFNTQAEGIRHLGPMAQDWYAAFGLGEGDTTISAVDADGVALAAIQGLYTVVQEKDAALAVQQAEVAALQDSLAAQRAEFDARLRALETGGAPVAGGYGQLPLGLLLGAGIGVGAFALGRKKSG